MDVSTLHTLTEDLAAFLSEVTAGDLRQPTSFGAKDLGDLYLDLIGQHVSLASAITGKPIPRGQWPDPLDRAALDTPQDYDYGSGFETGYRATARLMEHAFASTPNPGLPVRVDGLPEDIDLAPLYELQISRTIVQTWDIARMLGLPYQPATEVARRALRFMAMSQPSSPMPAGGAGAYPGTGDDEDIFAGVLALSGRTALG
ncbi:MAG: hypothetical protein QM589_08090 [Thermomicrobiales bacterium]